MYSIRMGASSYKMSRNELFYKKVVILSKYLENNYKDILKIYVKSYVDINMDENIKHNISILIDNKQFLKYFNSIKEKLNNEKLSLEEYLKNKGDKILSLEENLKNIFLDLIKKGDVEVPIHFFNAYLKHKYNEMYVIDKRVDSEMNWEVFNEKIKNNQTYSYIKLIDGQILFDYEYEMVVSIFR